jgi:hypothetical protein
VIFNQKIFQKAIFKMAKETQYIQVAPSAVNETIEIWRYFGWELMGTPQEVYNKDSHNEKRGDSLYSVTETTHYVKITFQREQSMPNYAELCDLEQKFHALPIVGNRPEIINLPDPSGCVIALSIVAIIIGVFALTLGVGAGASELIVVGVLFLIP